MSALIIIISVLLAWAAAAIMQRLAIIDTPIARSSHERPTPTAGGAAILAGFLACFALGVLINESIFSKSILLGHATELKLGAFGLTILLVCVVVIGVTGLLDDIFRYGTARKSLIMALVSALSAYALGPVSALPLGFLGAAEALPLPAWLGYGGAMLWIFAVMNIVNFMDGANGMMGLSAAISSVGLAALALMSGGAPLTLACSSALLVGLAGFLPYNMRNMARLFAGDIGALTAGFVFAIGVLLAAKELPQSGAIYLGPLFILPFMTDVFLTLIRRVRAGYNPLIAHNTHLYQRMIKGGASHMRVSAAYGSAAGLCAFMGLAGEKLSLSRTPLFLLGLSAAAIVIYLILLRRAQSVPA